MAKNTLAQFVPTCKRFYQNFHVTQPAACRGWLLRRAFDAAVDMGYLGTPEAWWKTITGQDLDW